MGLDGQDPEQPLTGAAGAPAAGQTAPIVTPRLVLVPATIELVQADLGGRAELAGALGVEVPASWPPLYYGPDDAARTLSLLEQGPAHAGWWLWYFVLRPADPQAAAPGVEERAGVGAGAGVGPVLIGVGGYKGPPGEGGTVEIGYAIAAEFHRRGYASEAVRGLLERAFGWPEVRAVLAETLPELEPSIGVLRKSGFRLLGTGSEPGVVRYELTRGQYEAAKSPAPPGGP